MALPLPFGPAKPGKTGDVRDGIRVGEILTFGEPAIHYRVQARRFVGVAIDGVRDPFRGVHAEVMGLTEHRTDTAHLKHQPLNDAIAARHVFR